ncbi:Rrf2 family transcriptional regulator [Thermotoga sp. KOL6]|uniref:Rrf2 family transcriptional regulator n=1 Tax=Thermotoga sp. KOL6 TaxID=126741 RepID=UPI001E5874D7|nr:Rrf2 family transcriptional regulator [Thermotoga sp. KOL6]
MRSEYALRLLIVMSREYGKYLSMTEILERAKQSVPREFAEKILYILRKAGIVKTKRGKSGGYMLARPPREVKVSDVIFLLDKKSKVFSEMPGCPDELDCVIRSLWKRVEKEIEKVLTSVTLEDLLKEQKEKLKQI